jgi:hypothetical protein
MDNAATPDRWRLLDFADLTDEAFVREAHRVLLGRSPSSAEADRRRRELRTRSSRMEIVVRLALSPEGRRAGRPDVRGLGLPALAAAARAIEAAEGSPVLARTVRKSERVGRSVLFGGSSRARPATRFVKAAVVVAVAVAVDRRLRRVTGDGGQTGDGTTR